MDKTPEQPERTIDTDNIEGVIYPDGSKPDSNYEPKVTSITPESSGDRAGFWTKKKIAAAIVTAVALGGGSAITVGAINSQPTAEAPADPSEAPTPKPTVVETIKPSPEVSSEFDWKINYSAFEDNWETSSRTEKLSVCNEFWENNKPKTDVIATPENTGPEIVRYYDSRLEIIYNLHGDSSNENNRLVAEKLAECVTTNHSPNGTAREDLIRDLSDVSDSKFNLEPTKVDNVTRYSSAIQTATDYEGVEYKFKAVEYNLVDESKIMTDTLRQAVFEWSDNGGWQRVIVLSKDTPIRYGAKDGSQPPVILDPSRADAPWQKDGK